MCQFANSVTNYKEHVLILALEMQSDSESGRIKGVELHVCGFASLAKSFIPVQYELISAAIMCSGRNSPETN